MIDPPIFFLKMRLANYYVTGGFVYVSLISNYAAATSVQSDHYGLSKDAAQRNGPRIFNTVHDAMRQWGSSVHHNGMSFMLATAPEGALFYHGGGSPKPPAQPDWLAYEIEHAAGFARGGPPPVRPPDGDRQFPIQPYESDSRGTMRAQDEKIGVQVRANTGWFHVYRATRPLRYLYIDGMSAGKTYMGTLDTQDRLLRGLRESSPEFLAPNEAFNAPGSTDEQARAADLCKLCSGWHLDGVIRMEAGFEVIHCNFSNGLEQIQLMQSPPVMAASAEEDELAFYLFEFVRGLSERYQGVGTSRTVLDFSSLVSAFFFPVNLTNSDPKRPDLPRLVSASGPELEAIKKKLTDVIRERRGLASSGPHVDWQGVSDLIVGRYADRLQYMAEKVLDLGTMKREIRFLLTIFIDFSSRPLDLRAANKRCTSLYLQAKAIKTDSDDLIRTAFETVTSKICSSLFDIREIIEEDQRGQSDVLERIQEILRDLIDWLGWARFKRCPPCGLDEVCMIPMWPIGSVDDYVSPRCINSTTGESGESYWGPRFRSENDPGKDSIGDIDEL